MAIDEGSLGPVELAESCLDRIESTDAALNAWVKVDGERALGRALELQRIGHSRDELQTMWGVPLAVKDIIDAEGLPTTGSSKVLSAAKSAESDAPVVANLRDGGAVVLGKTNTQEFAYGVVTHPTKNPWDPSRIPGGSSGGSAVAISSAHCPAALGSDTAGSIRIPSALCGITGLKPRPGIISLDGVIPLSPSFDAVGPMASSAADIALLWSAMTRSIGSGSTRFRLAVPNRDAFGDIDPEVASAFDAGVEELSKFASSMVTCEIPALDDFGTPRSVVLMSEALEVHRSRGWWPEHRDSYSEETLSYLEFAERFFRTGHSPGFFDWTAYPSYQTAVHTLAGLSARFRSFLNSADFLVMPTLPRDAPTHEEAARVDEGSPRRPVVIELTRFPGPANVAELAALTVPCGFTSRGLPIGLSLIGDDEWVLIEAGIAFQAETDWVRRPADLLGG